MLLIFIFFFFRDESADGGCVTVLCLEDEAVSQFGRARFQTVVVVKVTSRAYLIKPSLAYRQLYLHPLIAALHIKKQY